MKKIVEKILEKENILYEDIKQTSLGFTNNVFFVGDKVLKIADNEKSKQLLNKEIQVYKNLRMKCVPNYISSGEVDGFVYLIISKIEGVGLYSIWHNLSVDERKKCVEQISKLLNDFEGQNAEFLDENFKFLDWQAFIKKQMKYVLEKLDDDGLNTVELRSFFDCKIDSVFEKNKFGLVYNDAHFDNFIYNDGRLSLIDFDRVIYAPVDYELMIFKTMCDNPKKFASEEDGDFVFDVDFQNVYLWFKEFKCKKIEISFLEIRVAVYQFLYLEQQAFDMKNRKIGLRYEKKWIDEFLINIKS